PLEYLFTFGERDPGLLAARPDVPCRSQPRCVVEAAGTHPDHAAARLAVHPARTIRAYEPSVEPTAIRDALKRSRFTRREAETSLRQRDPQGEGAARDVLAVGAVACVDEARLLGDLIADLPALTAAGQRKLHHSISVSTLSVKGQRGSIGISEGRRERSHETTSNSLVLTVAFAHGCRQWAIRA